MKKLFAIFIIILVTGLPAHASLVTYGFENITNNNPVDAATGEAQFFVDVTNDGVGAGQVAFKFYNIGPLASSITDVYFDDGTLLGIASVVDGAGVDFEQGASPGDLPGGNLVGFSATAGFTADSEPPAQPNGANPGEFVTIIFNLQAGKAFADVINALALDPVVTGSLWMGIHVQGFTGGGSEGFVNGDPGNPIPEPATMLLFGIGLIGFARYSRKF